MGSETSRAVSFAVVFQVVTIDPAGRFCRSLALCLSTIEEHSNALKIKFPAHQQLAISCLEHMFVIFCQDKKNHSKMCTVFMIFKDVNVLETVF
jgi:hypothetical protein